MSDDTAFEMTTSGGIPTDLMSNSCSHLPANHSFDDDQPGFPETCPGDRFHYYWALLLLVFPILTLFGNVLVCLSVYRERSLHTVTNYFIVSLATADIMVAILVMPFAVYVEVNNSEWLLGDALCDTWVAFDVLCCTASILNLAAISVDRYIAITHPIAYSKHRQQPVRLCVMLILSWTVSIAISLPIAVGMNYTDRRSQTPTVCTFYNDDFLIYSSMGSFYIPCLVMFWLYCRMFRTIRQRAKRTSCRQKYQVANCRNGSLAAGAGYCPMRKIANSVTGSKSRETMAASGRENPMKAITEVNENGADTENKYCHTTEDLPEEAALPIGRWRPCSIDEDEDDAAAVDDDDGEFESPPTNRRNANFGLATMLRAAAVPSIIAVCSATNASQPSTECVVNQTTTTQNDYVSSARLSITKFNFYIRQLPDRLRKQNRATRRERKATKTLAIVLAVFLFCWVPFFTINILNAVCIRYDLFETAAMCRIDTWVFSMFVWLGYINSFLNPVIYTIFNVDFRRAFKRILGIRT